MRNKLVWLLLVVGAVLAIARTRAQASPQVYVFGVQAGTTVANCPVVAAGVTSYCFTAAGAYQSINGAAWASMVPLPIGTGVLTVNNKKPDSTGNVSLAATTSLQ